MNKNLIFTISRQYGTGGHDIGVELAKSMGLAFYDKELIALAAQQSGISKDLFENADEMPSNSFLYSLSMGTHTLGAGGVTQFGELLTNDKLFILQSQVIRSLADKGPCVIVGRCADYILRDCPRCVNVFIHADTAQREKHIQETEGLSEQAARDKVRKMDKKRASYCNYYSDVPWGIASSYHLCLDVTRITVSAAAELIRLYSKGL